MSEYDKEFESWFSKHFSGEATRAIAYTAWQAARAPKEEVKRMVLEGGDWMMGSDGKAHESSSHPASRDGGRERKTEELAETAAEKMRKRDRLHAFATEFMGHEHKFMEGEPNFYPGFDRASKRWKALWNTHFEEPGKSYMTKECAEYLCQVLDDGRLVL